jgi:hypothetical protein
MMKSSCGNQCKNQARASFATAEKINGLRKGPAHIDAGIATLNEKEFGSGKHSVGQAERPLFALVPAA